MGVPRLIVALAAAIAAQPSVAQDVIWQRVGVRDQLQLLGSRYVGDVDADGFADFVEAGWYFFTNPARYETGNLLVSGRLGQVITGNQCPDPEYDYTGWAFAGDVDGDGTAEFARMRQRTRGGGAFRPNVLEIRSLKKDLPIVWQLNGPSDREFGRPMLGNIDLNGDGRPDFLIAAPREVVGQTLGALYAFDHRGQLLFHMAPVPIGAVGLGRIGDFDKDGCDDFVVGGFEPPPGTRSGAFVHSGRTQQLLVAGYQRNSSEPLGWNAGGCGDIDADGVLDFWGAGIGEFAIGSVRVFSGATGQAIYTWTQPWDSGFGYLVDTADLDLDGVTDFLVGSAQLVPSTNSGGQLFYFSGRNGALVSQFGPPDLPPTWTAFGWGHSIAPPNPDSPFPVFTVGEHQYGADGGSPLIHLGRTWLMRSVPPGVDAVGTPCAGTLAEAPRIGYRRKGDGGRIHLTHAPADAWAVLLVGLSNASYGGYTLPLGLDAMGFTGCSLLNSIEVAVLRRTGTQGNDKGYTSVDVPRLPGSPLYAQWLVLGQGSFVPGGLSNGITW